MKHIKGIIQLTRGSKADWLARNPVVPENILILIKDEQKFYLADGVTAFAELPVWFDLKENLDTNHVHAVTDAFTKFIPKPIVDLNNLNLNSESEYLTPKSAKKIIELVFGITDVDIIIGTFSGRYIEVPTRVYSGEFELLIDDKYVPVSKYSVMGSRTDIRLTAEYPEDTVFSIRRSEHYVPNEYGAKTYDISKETRAINVLVKDKAREGHTHSTEDIDTLDVEVATLATDIDNLNVSTLDTIIRPEILSPAPDAVFSDETISVVGSEYIAIDESIPLNIAIVETSEYPDFRVVNGMWTSQTTTVDIPKGSLGPSRTYYYRLRYQSTTGLKSKHSDVYKFKTNTAFDYAVAPHPTKPSTDYITKTNDTVLSTTPVEPVSTFNIGDTVEEGTIFSFTNTVDAYTKDFVCADSEYWITTRFPRKLEFVYPFVEEADIVDVAVDSKNGVWYAIANTLYYLAHGADIPTEYPVASTITKVNVSDNDRLVVVTEAKVYTMLASGVLVEVTQPAACSNAFPYDDREFISVIDGDGIYLKLYTTHSGTRLVATGSSFVDSVFDGRNCMLLVDNTGKVHKWEYVTSPTEITQLPAVQGVDFVAVTYDHVNSRFILVGNDNGVYGYVTGGIPTRIKDCIVENTLYAGVDRNGLEYSVSASGLYRENSKLQEVHDLRNMTISGYDNWRLPTKDELDTLYYTKLNSDDRVKIDSRLVGMDIDTDTLCYLAPQLSEPVVSDKDLYGTVVPVRDELPNGYYIVVIGTSGRSTSLDIVVDPNEYVAAIVYEGKANWKLPSEAEASVLINSVYVDTSAYVNGILCDTGRAMTLSGAVDAVEGTSYGVLAVRYRALDGAVSVGVHWQISDTVDFSNIVYETNFTTTSVNQLYVPNNYIQPDKNYWYRVRSIITEDGLYSNWSNIQELVNFSTVTPRVINTALSGANRVAYRELGSPFGTWTPVTTGSFATGNLFGSTITSKDTVFVAMYGGGVYHGDGTSMTKLPGISNTVAGMDCNASDEVLVVERAAGAVIIDPTDMSISRHSIDNLAHTVTLRSGIINNAGTIFISEYSSTADKVFVLNKGESDWSYVNGFGGYIDTMYYSEDEQMLYVISRTRNIFRVDTDLTLTQVGKVPAICFAFWMEEGVAYAIGSNSTTIHSSTDLQQWSAVGTSNGPSRTISVIE